ncbi:MAG: hypothetical protein ACTHLZ_06460 [Tepidisphaeraceae bacterium]
MGVRENLNRNPALTTGLTLAVIVLSLAFIVYQIAGNAPQPAPVPQIFFTTDDGKTVFADDYQKIPPFDVDGKQAVRAYVFTCDGHKSQFVAYLERISAEARQKLDAELKQRGGSGGTEGISPETAFAMSEGTEVKRPGDADWVKRSDPKGQAIIDVKCPQGTGQLEVVSPND